MYKNNYSRRRFLKKASCAAMASTTMFNAIANLSMASAFAAPNKFKPTTGNYKAMVCISLAGGNDSFNMLIPRSATAYNQYQTVRSSLALDLSNNEILPLNYTDANGKEFGVHYSMPGVQQLFNDGKLSFLSNIGTLREPTTLAELENDIHKYPLGLLSHSDQLQQWQTSMPHVRSSKGWGGKVADIMNSVNSNPDISMSISLAGTNVFQQGNETIEFAITNEENGSRGIGIYDETDLFNVALKNGVQSLLEEQYQNVFKKTYAEKINSSQTTHETFSAAIAGVNPFATTFSDTSFSQDLLMAAKTIAACDVLGMEKQTFYIQLAGWDHHDELLNQQANLLAVLSAGLAEFNAVLEELNMSDQVTTFTISDFARTLTSNGNGTDHAWGGNVMVMGGDVNGGQIFGEYPDLILDSDIDLGGGVFLPSLTTDEYFAELALWFGVQSSDLPDILPNLQNFYTLNSGAPIGFLNF